MGDYDGWHLGQHTSKSEALIKTAVNLLAHCVKVSDGNPRAALASLADDEQHDEPFTVIGNGVIVAEQSSSMARAYVAQKSDAIVVAFRGSGVKTASGSLDAVGTLKNALTDVNLPLITDRKFQGKVHKGFAADYMQLRAELLARFRQSAYTTRGVTVYVTGFSLGAALATLCAYDLAEQFKVDPHTYLFAQPAAGNHDFARAFEQRVSRVFRFAHEKDVVSQIPHSLICDYKAPGSKLLVFNSNGSQVHHSNVTVKIKADRTAALMALGRGLRRAALASVAITVVSSFSTHHKPEYYKARMARMHRNYADNVLANSSMAQAADKQYQECQQHCLDL